MPLAAPPQKMYKIIKWLRLPRGPELFRENGVPPAGEIALWSG